MNTIIRYLLPAVLPVMMVMGSCTGRSQAAAGAAADSDTSRTAIIEFSSAEHDFGKVRAGERVACIFSYSNIGEGDLVITHASASCGCTVPKFSKKPLPPGGSGTIEVVFDTSGRDGMQSKTVVIQSNAKNNIVILRIIAEVTAK